MTAGTPPDGGHTAIPRDVHKPGHGTSDHAVSRIAGCPDPDCPAPAEVYAEAALDGTHGPVGHARTFCLNRHFYQLPVEHIPGYAAAGPVTSVPEPTPARIAAAFPRGAAPTFPASHPGRKPANRRQP